MDSIFTSYPEHPWIAQWRLEAENRGVIEPSSTSSRAFRTTQTVGRIVSDSAAPEWMLQIPVPQNSSVRLLYNGLSLHFEQNNFLLQAEMLVPAPGILCGYFSDIPAPTLLHTGVAGMPEEAEWIESESDPALLIIREDRFCLISGINNEAEARRMATEQLDADPVKALQREWERRSGAVRFFERMKRHDPLAVISVESMMRALRNAEGVIPGLWSVATFSEEPHLDTNALYGLAQAWSHIDIQVAADLILTNLKIQSSSGSLPVNYAPRENPSVLDAPKPLLAKLAEQIWKAGAGDDFRTEIIPLLRRHLQWALTHYDPKRKGIHCWQSRRESLISEIYENGMATVDLSILLLTEIEALNRMRETDPRYAEQEPFFLKEQEILRLNIKSQFWNEQEARFSNAIVRRQISKVTGFPSFLPLIWKNLPYRIKSAMAEHLRDSGNLPGGISMLSWSTSTTEPETHPQLQQMLTLDMLREADPGRTLSKAFSRLVLQGLHEWHHQSIQENGSLTVEPAIATSVIILHEELLHSAAPKKSHPLLSRASGILRALRIDTMDIAIVLACLLAVVAVRTVYRQINRPPPYEILDAQMNNAYASKNVQETLIAGEAIIENYPDQSIMAKYMTANVLLIQNRYERAAERLEDVRVIYPDSPGPMIALGLAYQLQGRFEEAEHQYYEFTYLFDEIFPEIVDIIERNRYLMEEGFSTPPKWQEIYRYQLMHELE